MSGALKEVRNRIKSVQSTQQITKAMKMVSAAKLRRAQDAITQMRPYAQKLQEVLSNIVSNSEGEVNMDLAAERTVEKVMIIIVTSDRGLCGGYNSNLIKLAKQVAKDKYPNQLAKGNVQFLPIGKKGYEHFSKNGFTVVDKFWNIFTGLSFDKVQAAAKHAMDAFANKELDAVELVYSEFKNAATQVFSAEQFLPVRKVAKVPGQKNADFIYEPSKEDTETLHRQIEELNQSGLVNEITRLRERLQVLEDQRRCQFVSDLAEQKRIWGVDDNFQPINK